MITKAAVWSRSKLTRWPAVVAPTGTLSGTNIKPDTVGTRCSSSYWFLGVKLKAPKQILAVFIVKVIEDALIWSLDRSCDC